MAGVIEITEALRLIWQEDKKMKRLQMMTMAMILGATLCAAAESGSGSTSTTQDTTGTPPKKGQPPYVPIFWATGMCKVVQNVR
jgi:hypothetical protein